MTGLSTGEWAGKARAKTNLRLRVLGREPSGYHRIDTDFLALELADDVSLAWTEDESVAIEVEGVAEGALGPADRNLAVLAARRFRDAAAAAGHSLPGVRIALRKAIPHGAGLGGGSSDAGAVLRGMNELCGTVFRRAELAALGAEIGADVPFFVSDLARARGTGRGDRITPLPDLPIRPVLLLLPSEPVPTAWAYAALAAARSKGGAVSAEPPATRAGLRNLEDWSDAILQSRNDFEDVLFPLRPELRLIRDALRAAGAELAMLSGSGSAVLGVFRTHDDVARATRALEAEASPPWIQTIRTSTVQPTAGRLPR